MTDARDRVLGQVRRSIGRLPGREKAAQSRLHGRPRGPLPARGQNLDQRALLELFQREAETVGTTVVRLRDESQVPEAVAAYLKQHNLPPRLRLAPDERLTSLPWAEKAPLLEVASGKAEADDQTALTGAFAAIAESGTLMLCSGPEAPTSLNFLPENHLVVLRASQIAGPMEEAWTRLRAGNGKDLLPRTVNFITGPSRTGDIEQRIELGAHGPRRLHVLLLEDQV